MLRTSLSIGRQEVGVHSNCTQNVLEMYQVKAVMISIIITSTAKYLLNSVSKLSVYNRGIIGKL